MRFKTCVLTGIVVAILAFLAQMFVLSRYISTPTVSDFDHRSDVTGPYRFRYGSRGSSGAWVNNLPLICAASVWNRQTCLKHIDSLQNGTSLTVEYVNLRMIIGEFPMTMSIKSGDSELFSQTPLECIKAWRKDNFLTFLHISLILGAIFMLFMLPWAKRM